MWCLLLYCVCRPRSAGIALSIFLTPLPAVSLLKRRSSRTPTLVAVTRRRGGDDAYRDREQQFYHRAALPRYVLFFDCHFDILPSLPWSGQYVTTCTTLPPPASIRTVEAHFAVFPFTRSALPQKHDLASLRDSCAYSFAAFSSSAGNANVGGLVQIREYRDPGPRRLIAHTSRSSKSLTRAQLKHPCKP